MIPIKFHEYINKSPKKGEKGEKGEKNKIMKKKLNINIK